MPGFQPPSVQPHHQENADENNHFGITGGNSKRVPSGLLGPSLISINSGAPAVQSLRPADLKQSVAEWIKLENRKDVILRNISGSLTNSYALRQSEDVGVSIASSSSSSSPSSFSSPVSAVAPAPAPAPHSDSSSTTSENDEHEFMDSAEMASDVDFGLKSLIVLSGTHIPPSLSDDATINENIAAVTATAASAKTFHDEDSELDLPLDTHLSFLNPYEEFVEVEPPRYGAPLAPNGTALDFSCLDRSHIKTFPLASYDDPVISKDELKLLSIWDYELKLNGGDNGLDMQGLAPQLDTSYTEEKTGVSLFFSKWLRRENQEEKDPWYRIFRSIDDSYDNNENLENGAINRSMLPLNFNQDSLEEYGDGSEMQVVTYVPSHV